MDTELESAATAQHGNSLEADGITVSFGALRALDDVSLSVGSAQSVGVVGPNGAGKTTLLNVLTGYVRPTRGTLRVLGEKVSGTHPHQLAKMGVGRSFQLADQFGRLSVEEFMLLGLSCQLNTSLFAASFRTKSVRREEEISRDAVRAQLSAFGMGDLGLARSLRTLPYGIRKRLDLARAVISGPKLLLVDEPTSGLSSQECDEVGSLLKTLHTELQIALLVVDHRVKFVMGLCDTLLALDFGKVLAFGPSTEVLRDEEVQRAYFGKVRAPVEIADPEGSGSGSSADN